MYKETVIIFYVDHKVGPMLPFSWKYFL